MFANDDRGDGYPWNTILVGAALGAMGALLVAPKSGKRLRRDIARQGERIRHRGRDMRFRAEDTMDELVERSNDALETAKDAVMEAQDAVRKATRSAR